MSKSLIVIFLSALPLISQADIFKDLVHSSPNQAKTIRIFSIQGSNTIGAEMAPNLIKNWFLKHNLTEIRVKKIAMNEQVVTARIEGSNTRVEVLVAAYGSGTGYRHLQMGTADIAASSRPINNNELIALSAYGDLRSLKTEHIIAIDGLAIIVNPLNSISHIDLQDLAAVFSGEIRNWSELGGEDAPIRLYARDENSGTWDSFKSLVLGVKSLATAQRFESNADLSDQVAADPYGIGFVGLTSVRSSKLLAVYDGESQAMLPNQLNIATEDYVLSRRLYMYTLPSAAPIVQEFMQFVLADAGQQVVEQSGFTAQAIQAVVPEFYEQLPASLKTLTKGAKRLTLNFRFEQGSARLDNKALLDLGRLVNYMQQNPKQTLVLIGFGDPKKTEQRSQLLSKLRAMTVRRELAKQGVYPQQTIGFGDDLLVADSDNDGRVRNRRVEVWVH